MNNKNKSELDKKFEINFLGTKTLETKNLILRKFKTSDYMDIYKNLESRDKVNIPLGVVELSDIEKVRQSIEKIVNLYKEKDETMYLWAITLKETNEVIGRIGADIYSKRFKAEIGYAIGDIFWNKGYATEALDVVTKYLFDEVNIHRIELTHISTNTASKRVIEKCGYKLEGVLKEERLDYYNEFVDLYMYARLKEK